MDYNMFNSPTSYSSYGTIAPKAYDTWKSNSYYDYSDLKPTRTVWDRFVDVANVGQYVSAGIAKGVVDKDSTVIGNVLKGLYQSSSALNPFSKGKDEWKFNYSEVLDDAGWRPESTVGKIAKGAVGMGLDIFLDPLTYVSGGTMGLIKGSGKGAAKAATGVTNIVDLLGDSAKYIDGIADLTKSSRMTQDVAEAIVKNSNIFKSGIDNIDVVADGTKLMDKFNELVGVYDKSADVTLSLANAPFGKKIANTGLAKRILGENVNKSLTLIDGDMLKAIGDKTIAPGYGALRNKIYGGKIGELFSTDHTLYKLGKSDPEKVYNYIKSIDMANGVSVNKVARDKIIREKGKELLGLSPKESEEVLKAMENKTIYHKIKKMTNFSETLEAKEYAEKIDNAKKVTKDKIEEILNTPKELEAIIDGQEGNLASSKQTLEHIKEKKINDLLDIDSRYAAELDKSEVVNKIIIETANEINPEIKKSEELFAKYKEFKDGIVQTKIDEDASGDLYKALKPKIDVELIPGQIPSEVLVDDTVDFFDTLSRGQVNDSTWRGYKARLKKDKFLQFKSRKASDAALEKLGEGWLQSTFPDGTTRIYPPGSKNVPQSAKTIIEKGVPKISNVEMIDDISEYLFGNKNFISYDTYDSKIGEIMKMVEDGKGKEEMIDYILNKSEFYNGKATEMYKYIAGEVGYGSGTDYPGWQEFYTDRVAKLSAEELQYLSEESMRSKFKDLPNGEEFLKKLGIPTDMNKRLNPEITELHKKNLKREYLKKMFSETDTAQGVEDIISTLKSTELDDWVTKNYDDAASAIVRGEFNIDDFMDEYVSGTRRQYHKGDVKGEVFKLANKEREEAFNYLNEQDIIRNYKTRKYPKTPEQLGLLEESSKLTEKGKSISDEIKTIVDRRKELDKDIPYIKKTINGTETDVIDPEYIKEITEESKYVSKLRAENKLIHDKAQKSSQAVLDSFVDGTTKPTEKNIVEYYDKAKFDKTSEQLSKASESKKLSNQIDEIKEKIRLSRVDMQGKKKTMLDIDYLKVNRENERKIFMMDIEIAKLAKQRNYANKFLMDSMGKFEYKPSRYDTRIFNGIIDEMDGILEKSFKKEFYQLSFEEREILYKASASEYKRKLSLENKIDPHKIIKEDAQKVIAKRAEEAYQNAKATPKRKAMSLDELANDSEAYGQFLERQRDLNRLAQPKPSMAEVVKKTFDDLPDDLKAARQIEIDKVSKRYDMMIEGIETNSMALEDNLEKFRAQLKAFDTSEVENLAREAKKYEDALNNSDDFETFVRANYGDDVVDEVVRKYNSDAGDYLLDDKVNLSDRSKATIEKLRKEFADIGEAEVGIGKLKQGQLDANKLDYLPHILTDEGKELFKQDEFIKRLEKFGTDSGYGREFNEFGKTRTITTIPDGQGGWISKPTIRELNDFFRDMASGKDMFKEDISEIYIARAIKHSDLMYDNDYMERMINIFGKEYTGTVDDGHNLAMNYGKLKHTTGQMARGNQALDISEAVGEYLGRKDIQNAIQIEMSTRLKGAKPTEAVLKKLNHEVVGEFVQSFMETDLNDDVRKIMYDHRLNEFVTNTKTTSMLDDLATPLAGLDNEQFTTINESVEALRNRYDAHIRKRSKSLFGLTKDAKSVEFDEYSIEEIGSRLNELLKQTDEIDTERVNRVLKRIDEMNNIETPKIGQIESAIFEKANRSRQVQIMKDQNKFLQMYDKFTHFIKVNQTAVSPAFHARNKTSNMFQSSLGVGMDALDKDLQIDAMNAMRFAEGKKGATDKIYKFVSKDGVETEILWSELYQAAKDYGAIDEGFFAKELGSGVGEGLLKDVNVKDLIGKGLDSLNIDSINKGLSNFNIDPINMDKMPKMDKAKDLLKKGMDRFNIDPISRDIIPDMKSIKVPGKYDPTDMRNFGLYKAGTQIGSTIENHDRFIHFVSQVKNGMDYGKAAESVNKFMFDYSDLTAFEQNVMKRIFPYYTWMRKNAPLQVEMMLEHPEKYRMIGKVMGGIEGMTNEEDRIDKRFVNDFAQDWVQTPFSATNEDDRQEPILWNPNLPFMDVNRIPDITRPIDSIKDLFAQTNPLIKVPIELAKNKNIFFDNQIAKRYDKDYYKPDENRLTKSIGHVANQFAVTPILSGLVNKTGLDFGLHLMNSTTGIKALSYDYDKYKAMKIQQLSKKRTDVKSNPGIIDSINRRLSR